MRTFFVIGSVIALIGISGWIWINIGWSLVHNGAEDPADNISINISHNDEAVPLLNGSPTGENAQNILPEVESLLTKFDTSNDPQYLIKAISLTKQQTPRLPEDAITSRIVLLQKLSLSYDPTYDTNPPPPSTMHVIPPKGYNVGILPEEIADPDLRQDYVDRIEEKKKITRIHKTQRSIRDLMEDIVYLYSIQNGANLMDIERELREQYLTQEMVEVMILMARQKMD